MLALLLALVMLASLLTMPIAAATPATIYKYFMNRAKTYGSASNGDYMYYYYINEDQSLAYGVFWDHTRKQVELCLFSSDFFVSLFLPSTGKTPYTGYIEVGSSDRANFTVKPAS